MLAPKTNTGQIIRDALKRLHKTQAWLAEQCGVSDNAVSLWIKTGEVGRENAVQAARLLEVPVGALISDENPLSALIGEAVLSLGDDEVSSTLDFLLFKLSRAEAIYDGDKVKRYADMIERIKADMAKRAKEK